MTVETFNFPALTLVGLQHTADPATACDDTLPRVTTYAAMQGLWRPSLTASETGLAVLWLGNDGEAFCGLTCPPDAKASAPLALRIVTDGTYATCHHKGPWDSIADTLDTLRRQYPNGTACLCVFQTNPRSTPPADWHCELRLLLPQAC